MKAKLLVCKMKLYIFLVISMIVGMIIFVCMSIIDLWVSVMNLLTQLAVFLIILPIIFLFVGIPENNEKNNDKT